MKVPVTKSTENPLPTSPIEGEIIYFEVETVTRFLPPLV
jgi:hypothetical protein